MNKQNQFFHPKPDSVKGNLKQYNALVRLTKERKFGVRSGSLSYFVIMLKEFASLLWDIDPHVEGMHKRGRSGFKSSVIKLLGFNDPKKNKHKISPLNGTKIEQKVLKLESKLD